VPLSAEALKQNCQPARNAGFKSSLYETYVSQAGMDIFIWAYLCASKGRLSA
jgi:hypothetical protein